LWTFQTSLFLSFLSNLCMDKKGIKDIYNMSLVFGLIQYGYPVLKGIVFYNR
jgi:hypothetical protein